MPRFRRFAYLLLVVLLLVAQRDAAVHAISHAGEPPARSDRSGDTPDSLPHHCPDCARFASLGACAPPAVAPACIATAFREPVVVAIAFATLTLDPAPPRSRGPPLP